MGVAAGELSALEIEAPDEATAGSPFDITVTARDEFGNLLADYAGTVHFTSTDPAADLPSGFNVDERRRRSSASLS